MRGRPYFRIPQSHSQRKETTNTVPTQAHASDRETAVAVNVENEPEVMSNETAAEVSSTDVNNAGSKTMSQIVKLYGGCERSNKTNECLTAFRVFDSKVRPGVHL